MVPFAIESRQYGENYDVSAQLFWNFVKHFSAFDSDGEEGLSLLRVYLTSFS